MVFFWVATLLTCAAAMNQRERWYSKHVLHHVLCSLYSLGAPFFIHLHETTLWWYFLSTKNRTIDNWHNWTCLSCLRLQRQLFSWSCSLVIWTSETKWKIFHCMSHGKFSYEVKVNVFNCENFMVGNLRTAPDNGVFMWAMWIYLPLCFCDLHIWQNIFPQSRASNFSSYWSETTGFDWFNAIYTLEIDIHVCGRFLPLLLMMQSLTFCWVPF